VPPPPAAKVSGDTNVNMSDIAPCLAAVKECGSVGWDFCLARQHGSVSAVHPKTLSSPHYRNHLLTVLTACCVLWVTVHSNSHWHHNTNLLSPHTTRFKLSVIRCSDNCVGHLNNNRAYRGDIMVVQSLSEEQPYSRDLFILALFYWWSMGKRAVLIVSIMNQISAYRDQFHPASQPKAASHFALLWDKSSKWWWKLHLWRTGGSISNMCRAVGYKKWHRNIRYWGVGKDDLKVLYTNAVLSVLLACSYFVVNSFSSSYVHFMSLRTLQHSHVPPMLI
jgi:hypothetical protein